MSQEEVEIGTPVEIVQIIRAAYMGAGLADESFIKLVKFLLTSRVMVLPVRVFTKICMVAPTSLTSETNPIDQHIIGETHIVNTNKETIWTSWIWFSCFSWP